MYPTMYIYCAHTHTFFCGFSADDSLQEYHGMEPYVNMGKIMD